VSCIRIYESVKQINKWILNAKSFLWFIFIWENILASLPVAHLVRPPVHDLIQKHEPLESEQVSSNRHALLFKISFYYYLPNYASIYSLASILLVCAFVVLQTRSTSASHGVTCFQPFGAGIIFFILAHPVYKMWIIQEPNTLELWNKLHFEEKRTESIYHV